MNKIVCFRYSFHIQKFLESGVLPTRHKHHLKQTLLFNNIVCTVPTYNHLNGASEVHWQPLSSATLFHDVSF